jgi:hypothetical protein
MLLYAKKNVLLLKKVTAGIEAVIESGIKFLYACVGTAHM